MQITDEMLAVLNESRELSFDEEIKDAEALIRKTAKRAAIKRRHRARNKAHH